MEAQLSGRVQSDAELVAWLAAGGLRDVDTLVVWGAELTDTAAIAIAADEHARSLASIDVSWNHVGAAGAAALAGLGALRKLRLYHNDAGLEGAHAVAELGGALESLNLCGNAIGDQGLAVLSRGTLSNLSELALGWNGLGSEGVEALVGGRWPRVEFLNIRCNRLVASDAARLLSGALPALTRLGLDENQLGPDGLAAIVDSPGFAQLAWLNLGGVGLDDHAFAAHWPFDRALPALRELRVHDNDLSAAMIARLRGALPGCEVLV